MIAGLNEIMSEVKGVLGADEVHRIMGFFKPDDAYPAMFTQGDDELVKDIKGEPVEAVSPVAYFP